MKKILFFLILSLALFGCELDDCCCIKSHIVFVYVIDENGNDMLDPERENSYKKEDIKIYDSGGKHQEVEIEGGAGGNKHYFAVFLGEGVEKKDGFRKVYIKIKDDDPDVIRYETYKKGCSEGYSKLWLNEEYKKRVEELYIIKKNNSTLK